MKHTVNIKTMINKNIKNTVSIFYFTICTRMRISYLQLVLFSILLFTLYNITCNVESTFADYKKHDVNVDHSNTAYYDSDNSDIYEELLKQIRILRGDIELLRHEQEEMKKNFAELEKHYKHDVLPLGLDAVDKVKQDTAIVDVSSEGHPKNNLKNSVVQQNTPEELYQSAYANLRRASNVDNSDAEKSFEDAVNKFEEFVKLYPTHPLVSNAYYWLGQIHTEKHNYANAIKCYMQGYKSAPKGGRATDNLIKLAEMLAANNQKSAACTTLEKLNKEFKNLKKSVKSQSDSLKSKLRC